MMDPQKDLYGNTIHEDIGGNRYIHDGYGQRDYLDKDTSSPPPPSNHGGGGGGGGDYPTGGGGTGGPSGDGGGGGGGAGGCSGCLTLIFVVAGLYFAAGYFFQPKNPPRLLPRPPQPTDSSSQTSAPDLPTPQPNSSPDQATSPETPTPASNPAIRLDWYGKLQLVETHFRTGAVKNSIKWTDIRLAVERNGHDVVGEIHFVEANVFAAVRGKIQEPTCQLIVERVLSGPNAAVIVPCVLTGKHDAKQVFRGHWNAGVIGNESAQNPRFWLTAGQNQ